MARLAITLLGPFGATLDGEPLKTFKSHKVEALLAYLAAEPHRPHPRSVLADLLWPERTDRDARRNLSYALTDLRDTIHDHDARPPFLRIDRDALQLVWQSEVSVDALEVLACVGVDRPTQAGPSDLQRAVALYRGPFLEGFSVNSAPFEEWLAVKREQYARLALGALRRLGEFLQQDGISPDEVFRS